ncbi:MAG: hypothetical protein H6Q00_1392 [Holophagaceae bacterium]|nr:hypothetical protein [Holophagaceae bacterium]
MSTIELAAALAHRACCNEEHDPEHGKIAGFCVVCGVPWPCETAKTFLLERTAPDHNEDNLEMVNLRDKLEQAEARVKRLEGVLKAEGAEIERLVDRLQTSEDANGVLHARLAAYEAAEGELPTMPKSIGIGRHTHEFQAYVQALEEQNTQLRTIAVKLKAELKSCKDYLGRISVELGLNGNYWPELTTRAIESIRSDRYAAIAERDALLRQCEDLGKALDKVEDNYTKILKQGPRIAHMATKCGLIPTCFDELVELIGQDEAFVTLLHERGRIEQESRSIAAARQEGAEKERERLMGWLIYAHKPSCRSMKADSRCTCGLREALEGGKHE